MNLPNKLTLLRIILVPVYILLYIKSMYILALIVFSIASITDLLDGIIARKNNLITNFGKIMDPLADKVLVYSAFLLFIPDLIPTWIMIVILAREFLVAGVRTVAASQNIVIAADVAGKIKTDLQVATVIAFLLYLIFTNHFNMFFKIASYVLLYASLLMTIYSGASYIVKNKKVFK